MVETLIKETSTEKLRVPRPRHRINEKDGVVSIFCGNGVIRIDASDRCILDDYLLTISHGDRHTNVLARRRGQTSRTVLSRLLVHAPIGFFVDHIDGDTLNNTRANLRIASVTENNRNKVKTKRPCTSRYKGVCLASGKWAAQIYVRRKQIFLGVFTSEVRAAKAYDAAARNHFGDSATLNFPDFGEQSALRSAAGANS